jgi:hypothetical protein
VEWRALEDSATVDAAFRSKLAPSSIRENPR